MSAEILDPQISDFLAAQLPERPPQILALEEEAEKTGFPIVGPDCGRVLETMARAVAATRVLELGSGFGYSAYWFSRGLRAGSEIVCTDRSEAHAARAKRLHEAVFPHVGLTFLVGDALTQAREMPDPQPFDVVFTDVDKQGYPDALDFALTIVKPGGAIIFDNVFYHRRIFAEAPNADAAGVVALHRKLREAKSLRTFIVPIRDGVSVSIRE
jgi:predicted O-methyltransferase YrrM